MKTLKAKPRLILALERFVRARTRGEKALAARWVNAWNALYTAGSNLRSQEISLKGR